MSAGIDETIPPVRRAEVRWATTSSPRGDVPAQTASEMVVRRGAPATR